MKFDNDGEQVEFNPIEMKYVIPYSEGEEPEEPDNPWSLGTRMAEAMFNSHHQDFVWGDGNPKNSTSKNYFAFSTSTSPINYGIADDGEDDFPICQKSKL